MSGQEILRTAVDLDGLRIQVGFDFPDLKQRLETYIAEAEFALNVFAEDWQSLPKGSCIVEIGSGSGLFSQAVSSIGFRVIAVEPAAVGFSSMHVLRELVVKHAKSGKVEWVEDSGESVSGLESTSPCLVLSFNVIEHVESVGLLLHNVTGQLASGSQVRIVCPNYDFPYEPHFNTWTLVSKRWTARFMGSRIARSTMEDAEGLWNGLSWPSVRSIRKIMRGIENCSIVFSRDATLAYVERVVCDENFQTRKGLAFRVLGRGAEVIQLVVRVIPLRFLPVIDCRIVVDKR